MVEFAAPELVEWAKTNYQELKLHYLMMNKPCGVVCKSVADWNTPVFELLSPELQKLVSEAKRGQRLHTVGRLDCNTSGLLIITDDGKLSHHLTAPENLIEKTYIAKLATPVSLQEQTEYIAKAAKGLILPAEKKAVEEQSAPAKLEFTEKGCIITVTEGKFHEVRRLFRALGNEVTELKRISIGSLNLDENLKPGQYRPLTELELSRLK